MRYWWQELDERYEIDAPVSKDETPALDVELLKRERELVKREKVRRVFRRRMKSGLSPYRTGFGEGVGLFN
jgi:hypothetical protein